MSLKKMIVSGAAALAIMSTAATAANVNVQEDGTGDYLLAPVYYAVEKWDTTLKVVNTNINQAIVAKVVIREAKDSREIMDFPIYLTPGDVWEGTIKVKNGHVVVESTDDSMMLGFTASGAPQLQGSASTPVVIDNSVPADPNQGSNWYGYVEIFGLAAYDANAIDPTWNVYQPLDKVKFYKAVRSASNPTNLQVIPGATHDVDNDSLMGKQTIARDVSDVNGKRTMMLNLYALGNVAETPRVIDVIGTNTQMNGNVPRSVSEKASAADQIDAALAKSHVYVMYEGDGTKLNPMRTHFTVPTKKYHHMQNGGTLNPESEYLPNTATPGAPSKWYYTIDTRTTVFRDMKEHANYCSASKDDISGNADQNCPVIKIHEEVHMFNNTSGTYIAKYAFKEGGYIDFDLTGNTVDFDRLNASPVQGMPVVPTSFYANKLGNIYLNNHLYNQYRKAEPETIE